MREKLLKAEKHCHGQITDFEDRLNRILSRIQNFRIVDYFIEKAPLDKQIKSLTMEIKQRFDVYQPIYKVQDDHELRTAEEFKEQL